MESQKSVGWRGCLTLPPHFDGGGGVEGWRNASETFNVTLEMVRRGYTDAQIEKIWSGNTLRVLTDVQKVAARLQSATM